MAKPQPLSIKASRPSQRENREEFICVLGGLYIHILRFIHKIPAFLYAMTVMTYTTYETVADVIHDFKTADR